MDVLNFIYKLIMTRQENAEGMILHNISIGKLWELREKEENHFGLTVIKYSENNTLKTTVAFETLHEVQEFVNKNWKS